MSQPPDLPLPHGRSGATGTELVADDVEPLDDAGTVVSRALGTGPGLHDEDADAVRGAEGSGRSVAEPAGRGEARRSIDQVPVDGLVAGLFSLFVLALLNWPDPDGWGDLVRPLLLVDTTPSGGDMGAHVWGPAFLRDHLLAGGRLTGWTPDWYAGFPAFHFYMVVPALAIVAVNAGFVWYLGLPLAALAVAAGARAARRFPSAAAWIIAAAVVVAVLLVGVPYGVAFKLVSVSGLVLFPLSAWAMGRLAGAPRPVPAFLSMAAFIFLFDTNFTIYGGNIASTLAGEFAFSISLCLTLLAIGIVIRGMADARWRAAGAVVVALVALCHIIPVFFLVPALLLAVLAADGAPRSWVLAGMVAFALVPIAFADGSGTLIRVVAVVAAAVVVLAAMTAEPTILRQGMWLLLVGPTAIALTGFWLVPFYLREPYFNDMGWERLNDVGAPLLTVPIKIALPVAAIGFLVALANREKIGMVFAGTGLIFASAVANLGEGPLWNARLLPLYYLSVYVVAAVGVAFAARFVGSTLSADLDRPDPRVVLSATLAATLAVLIAVSMPLRIMPFGQLSASGDGSYRWLVFTNQARSLVPGWAAWNYSGYEEKPSYGEYHHVVSTMATVGDERGCGRAMWEYEKGLDRYGTPMALMLLPHWTDGCIGSMEGLYFESSATTPFHFLNQSVLSETPSRAQRDLPYLGFDIDTGIDQLQVMGVRYYLAQSDTAIEAARNHPDLTEVTEAQPFVVFEVAGSALVQGLAVEPVITEGRTAEEVAGPEGDPEEISRFETGWVSQAVAFYNEPSAYPALPAEDGPAGWSRQELLSPGAGTSVEPAEVSDIEVDTDSVSFTVDRPGTPVLVKVSYFPNWEVDGAEGPWRVGPNLMVVVPTDERVELSYGLTAVDLGGQALTLLGLAGVVALGLADRGRLRRTMVGRVRRDGDDGDLGETSPDRPVPVGSTDADPAAPGLEVRGPSAVGRHGPDRGLDGRWDADGPVEPEPTKDSAVVRSAASPAGDGWALPEDPPAQRLADDAPPDFGPTGAEVDH